MKRLLWPLGLVVAFGLGLLVSVLPRPDRGTAPEVERLQMQVSTLQARLRAREANVTPPAGAAPTARRDIRSTDRLSEGAALNASLRTSRPEAAPSPRGEVVDRGSSPERAAQRSATPAPTVETALERFYSYLDESGTRGQRWQRMQQLVDELKGMGSAGAEALMRVLASGTSADERRAAAQLLGELGAPGALASLQEVLERDGDVLLRRAAASGLRRLQTPESAPYMEALMSNPAEDRFVRMSAASGLAQLGRTQGVAGLSQIFDESNGDGRGRDMAFRAIRSLDDERAVPFMRRVVTSDAEVTYRLQAIRFLAAQGDRQALPSLQQIMQSPTEQPSIRDAAAQAHATLAGR